MGEPLFKDKTPTDLLSAIRLLKENEADGRLSNDARNLYALLRPRAEATLENHEKLLRESESPGLATNLSIQIRIAANERQISFSLDTLGKEETVRRIGQGGLFDEISTLYLLAHLPGTDSYTLNVHLPDIDFDIIDRVCLNLDVCFHPGRQSPLADLLETLTYHPPYNKSRKIEAGLRWLREKAAGSIR